MSVAAPSPRPSDPLAGDVWGGFAAMLVALPSAIAYGVAVFAVLGPEHVPLGVMAGILGTVSMGVVASMFTGAPRLISAPCAPAAAVLAALVAGWSGAGIVDPGKIGLLLVAVGVGSAVLQLVYAAIGGGRLIKFIPYPVVAGYLSGVAVLVFLSQVPKFVGAPSDTGFWGLITSPGQWRWESVLVGVVTVGGMIAAQRWIKAVPALIVGLGSGVLCYFLLAWFEPGLRSLEGNRLVIGKIEQGVMAGLAAGFERWGSIRALTWGELGSLVFPALTLSVLLSIDTLKTCVVVDALTRSRSDSNRTLLSQGLGNLVSALVGGMPGAGSMGPTLINVTSGAQTRRSGIIEGTLALLACVLFGSFIAWVPLAALAGILFFVAFRMFDWNSFALLRSRATVLDFLVIASVVVVAVRVNLVAAAAAGVGLAIVLFLREQVRGSVIRRKVYGNRISSMKHRPPSEASILELFGDLHVVCELHGSLFFGTADQLYSELEGDLQRCRRVILDMRRVQSVDFTAAHLLQQMAEILHERGGWLAFSDLPEHLPTGRTLRTDLQELGVTLGGDRVRVFDSLEDALEWAEDELLGEHARDRAGLENERMDLSQFEVCCGVEADEGLEALRACAVERHVAAGSAVFHLGDVGDEIFLIRRGTIRIQLPTEGTRRFTLALFDRGSFFGEVAFLDRGTRTADAVAVTDADLYAVPREGFDAAVKACPQLGTEFFARLARGLAHRLRRVDVELRTLQSL